MTTLAGYDVESTVTVWSRDDAHKAYDMAQQLVAALPAGHGFEAERKYLQKLALELYTLHTVPAHLLRKSGT